MTRTCYRTMEFVSYFYLFGDLHMPYTKNKSYLGKDETKFFKVFRRLLVQKKEIDGSITKMEKKLLRMMNKRTKGYRKRYVLRVHNSCTLQQAIRKCMIPNEAMKMTDVLSALSASGFRSNSDKLYTMVNNKLNRDPKVTKVRRGTFVFSGSTEQSHAMDIPVA